jgi:FXSXX-COOH protein
MTPAAVPTSLVDLSDLSFDDLDDLPDSILARALHEFLDPNRKDDQAVAGFTSTLPPL